jgi:hypothetical protein
MRFEVELDTVPYRVQEQPGARCYRIPRSGTYLATFGALPETALEPPVPVKLPLSIGPAGCGDAEAHAQLACDCWCECTGTWHSATDCP